MCVKVSVIIPVYNAEPYLEACMDSLVRQTLTECEFIFVNDGSADRSREMIRSLQARDSRVKLIDQPNQGVSIARNNGLRIASGEYIGFVDADDYIDSNMFETLYQAARQGNCDAVLSNLEIELDGHRVTIEFPFTRDEVLGSAYIDQAIIPYLLQSDHLNSVCNKLYRADRVRDGGVIFPEREPLGEDGMFNLHFFAQADAVKYIGFSGYHYRETAGSATRSLAKKDYFQRALDAYDMDLTGMLRCSMDTERLRALKSIKLVTSVMSFIHLYFTPTRQPGFPARYAYVKRMIGHEKVRDALHVFARERYERLGRFDRALVKLMTCRFTPGLFLAVTYSRLRNQ